MLKKLRCAQDVMRYCKGCVCLCAWLAVGVLLFNCIMQRSGFQWTQALQQKQQLFQAQPVRPVPFLLSLIIFFFSLLLNSPSASSVVSLCTHSTCSTCTSNGAVDIFSLPPDVRTAQLSSVTSRMVTNHFHKCSYLRLWNALDRALFTTQMFSHPLPA